MLRKKSARGRATQKVESTKSATGASSRQTQARTEGARGCARSSK